MKLETLHDLFVEQLKDLYSAEKQIIEALPKMAEAASTPELREAFQNHLTQSVEQKARLSEIFSELGVNPGNKVCKAMEGLITEGDEMTKKNASPIVRDAGLIAAAQRVEHYEMAGYGTVRTFARELGYKSIARTLQNILDEESKTNELLTDLAVGGFFSSGINAEAEMA